MIYSVVDSKDWTGNLMALSVQKDFSTNVFNRISQKNQIIVKPLKGCGQLRAIFSDPKMATSLVSWKKSQITIFRSKIL